MKLLNVNIFPKVGKNVSSMSTVILVTYCFLFLTAHELVDLTANLKKKVINCSEFPIYIYF